MLLISGTIRDLSDLSCKVIRNFQTFKCKAFWADLGQDQAYNFAEFSLSMCYSCMFNKPEALARLIAMHDWNIQVALDDSQKLQIHVGKVQSLTSLRKKSPIMHQTPELNSSNKPVLAYITASYAYTLLMNCR